MSYIHDSNSQAHVNDLNVNVTPTLRRNTTQLLTLLCVSLLSLQSMPCHSVFFGMLTVNRGE